MGGVTNLFRRGAVYYYRRTMRWRTGERQCICLSLRTRRLGVARHRATLLAAYCERLHARLGGLMTDKLLSSAQRHEIFNRQLIAERDRLDALHVGVVLAGGPSPGSYFDDKLGVMEQVCSEWIINGPPPPGSIEAMGGLDAYVAETFPGLDEDDQWELSTSLGQDDIVEHWLNLGAEAALLRVNAACTPLNKTAALKALFAAKLEAVRAARAALSDPASAYRQRPAEARLGHLSFDAFGDLPNEPLYHLMDIVQLDEQPTHAFVSAHSASSGPAPVPTIGTIPTIPAEWASTTIVEAAERFIREVPKAGAGGGGTRRKRWDEKTRRQFITAAMLAGKATPGPVAVVTHADLLRLNALFERLPRNHHKSPRHKLMTLEQIADEAAAKVRNGTLATPIGLETHTTNRHFRFLRELFDWVGRSVPSIGPFYWSDLIESDTNDDRDACPAYSAEQGRAFFALPIWTGCESAKHRLSPGNQLFHDAAYWVPILIWYGAERRGEVCKALLNDVQQQDGIWYLWIDFSVTGRIKNKPSRRAVPLHDEIIRLGFIDYMQALRDLGETWLFPELKAAKSSPGDVWYKRWWRKIRIHLDFLVEGQALHSMRHMADTELKEARVFPEFRRDLLGHGHESETEGRYAKLARVTSLKKVVGQIPVVTDHLKASPINLLPQLGTNARHIAAKRERTCDAQRAPEVGAARPRPRLVWNN